VLKRRADGYHDLVTIFQPLSLADELTVSPGGAGIDLVCDHPQVPLGEENLVWRAARAFEQETGQTLGVRIRLLKRIPVAAGLGGGSSDAAGTLLALNTLAREPLEAAALHRLAGCLGADVPFFLTGGPALGRGTGTDLTPLTLPAYWYLLLNPQALLSTRWVYENLNLGALAGLPILEHWDWERPEDWVKNDLETVAVKRFPELKDTLEQLGSLGARARAVSGSGPTIFGLFTSADGARRAAGEMRRAFSGWMAIARGLTGPGDTNWESQVWIL